MSSDLILLMHYSKIWKTMKNNKNEVLCDRCSEKAGLFSLNFPELDTHVCIKCRYIVSEIFKSIIRTPIHDPDKHQEVKVIPLTLPSEKIIEESLAEFGYGKL